MIIRAVKLDAVRATEKSVRIGPIRRSPRGMPRPHGRVTVPRP